MLAKVKTDKLLWIDLEMTGLDPKVDEIIEIAAIVTDSELNNLGELAEIYISQPPERFEKMDDWNRTHHTDSGLWQKVLESKTNIAEAEQTVLRFLDEHSLKNNCLLCGNSIWQDRRFITKYMPELEKRLHYRMIDISTLKELARRWYPSASFDKEAAHRALDDIRESITELAHYRKTIFISQEQ